MELMETTSDAVKDEEKDHQESVTVTPSDILKPYFFGCGPVHPKWLQVFANKKFFTFLACCFTCAHSSLVSGVTSVVLSTLQTRYQFSSLEASFIIISYDLSVAIGITFVSYFGKRFHKPRVLGIGCLTLGVTALLYASPQFIFGEYTSGITTSLNEQCQLSNHTVDFVEDCSSGNRAALFIFILCSILLSFSASLLYTLGTVYIDEIVYPRFVSLHIGVFYVCLVFGPAIGYIIGSFCLSVYVDPWVDTTLTESDPAWVGAWWLPFILVGVVAFILAIPFLMFPKWLHDSHLVRKERRKEMARIYSGEETDGKSSWVVIKSFGIQIYRLLRNPSFILASSGLAVLYVFSQGVISFAPKYLENQFYLSASVAGLTTGLIAIPASIIGVLLGSILIYKFKWKGRKNILAVCVIMFVDLPFLVTFILYCPTVDLAGVTVAYSNRAMDGIDGLACNAGCNCSSNIYEPVCGNDGVTYFSACRAGCVRVLDTNVEYDYENCSCIGTSPADGVTNGTATMGACESTCILLAPTLVLFTINVILAFIPAIPYQHFMLRVVSDDQRAIALGFQSTIWRIFGGVPGPLLFGGLFDLSCAIWQEECGRRGNCWLYHNNRLSIYVVSVGLPCMVVSGVLFFFAFLTYPKQQKDVQQQEMK